MGGIAFGAGSCILRSPRKLFGMFPNNWIGKDPPMCLPCVLAGAGDVDTGILPRCRGRRYNSTS